VEPKKCIIFEFLMRKEFELEFKSESERQKCIKEFKSLFKKKGKNLSLVREII
jgi:hypothetical protein